MWKGRNSPALSSSQRSSHVPHRARPVDWRLTVLETGARTDNIFAALQSSFRQTPTLQLIYGVETPKTWISIVTHMAILWSDFEHFWISGSIICRELFLSLTRCFRGTSSFRPNADSFSPLEIFPLVSCPPPFLVFCVQPLLHCITLFSESH